MIDNCGISEIIIVSVYDEELHLFVTSKLTTYSPGLEKLKEGSISLSRVLLIKFHNDELLQVEIVCWISQKYCAGVQSSKLPEVFEVFIIVGIHPNVVSKLNTAFT